MKIKVILPIMVATVAVCSYIKYQKTEVEIARFDYRMRVMKEESYRMQNGRGLFADESGEYRDMRFHCGERMERVWRHPHRSLRL